MKMRKQWLKVIILLFSASILFGAWGSVSHGADNANVFAGTRNVKYVVDCSDFENYFNGGRAAFDYLLRGNAPDWMNYQMFTEGRDVYLEMGFDFVSFDDYSAKLTELYTYSPKLAYRQQEELLLLEKDSAEGMLNLFQKLLQENTYKAEKTLNELFQLVANEITIGENTYKGTEERLSIRPKQEAEIKFAFLKLHTVGKKNGGYERSITLQLNAADYSEEVVNAFIRRLKKAGKVTEVNVTSDIVEYTVEFDVLSQEKLIEKTEACLGAAIFVSEQQEFKDETTVRVTCSEFIDITGVLQEESSFQYSFEYPDYFHNVSATDDSVVVGDAVISAQNTSWITYHYERGFRFDTIEIETDFSQNMGRLQRSITLIAPKDIATAYHDIIKEQLWEHLPEGTVLNIYDEKGMRYYEIRYSSWFMKDIELFSEAILNSANDVTVTDNWLPFGKSSLEEKVAVNSIILQMVPADSIGITYRFPKMTQFLVDQKKMENVTITNNATDKSIRFCIGKTDTIYLEYRRINGMKLLIEFAVTFIGLIIVIILCKKVISGIKTWNSAAERKKEQKSDVSACPQCGHKIIVGRRFCEKCGCAFTAMQEPH